MRTVRIVGGGLTGILAAFEAHRLGAREIVLHERFDDLGGVARTRNTRGLELREGAIYFGPPGDEMVALLQDQGVAFDVFENRFGSVSPGATAPVLTDDFGGPALRSAELGLAPYGDSLTSRLAAYPQPIRDSLIRYAEWHLGPSAVETADESAAIPLAINRVALVGHDPAAIVALKSADPLYDELYGVPRGQWGRVTNSLATLPRGGFAHMFDQCRARLLDLGVRIETASLISPRETLLADRDREVVVWAANPTPLFKPLGLKPPSLIRKSFAAYSFQTDWTGPLPFYVQNFTAEGAVFRVYLYETGGQAVVTAECVRECDNGALRRELAKLTEGWGALTVGGLLGVSVQPRWIYHTIDALRSLQALRAAAAQRLGGSFVAGAWEPYGKTAKYREVRDALDLALIAEPIALQATA